MRPGLFPEKSFDVVCFFQVLDHLFDPTAILKTCFDILKPGGFVLCLNHNVEALSAKIMKDKSPIIDIEHTYLYSPRTISELLTRLGYQMKETGGVRNRYSLAYLTRLVPMPRGMKESTLAMLNGSGLGRLCFSVPLGNLYAVAQRPDSSSQKSRTALTDVCSSTKFDAS